MQLVNAEEPVPESELSDAGTLDCRGRLLLPGLNDAHVHAIATGMLMLTEDIRSITSLDDLADAIRAEAAKSKPAVRLGGLDRNKLPHADEQRLSMRWLDDVVPDRPLFIKSIEGHSGWYNAHAWEMIGADAVLARFATTQEAAQMHQQGRIHGHAYEELTTPVYDSFSFEERREGMQLVLTEAARVGLTGIHCLEGYGEFRRHDFELIMELDGQGCDLTLYARDETPELAAELGLTRFGGCWCVDGAIGSQSAAVSAPYTECDGDHCCGELYFDYATLSAWVESGLSRGMQVCNHAIGDRAIDQILDVYEELSQRYDLGPLRPRIDHFVLGNEQQAKRAASLGLCCAMQPAFDAAWGGPGGGYAKRLGPERAMQSNPVGMAVRSGFRIAGSSDAYITPLDPLGGIHAAMQHHNPEMRVDFDTAVRLFTEDAAYLAHQEESRGRIAEGHQADFTIVDGDRCMLSATVSATIKNGEIVYAR
ncbi:MAG: amidohydrolase family protein [bacterium]|nr:amidohydrolase family protein [bacterium]